MGRFAQSPDRHGHERQAAAAPTAPLETRDPPWLARMKRDLDATWMMTHGVSLKQIALTGAVFVNTIDRSLTDFGDLLNKGKGIGFNVVNLSWGYGKRAFQGLRSFANGDCAAGLVSLAAADFPTKGRMITDATQQWLEHAKAAVLRGDFQDQGGILLDIKSLVHGGGGGSINNTSRMVALAANQGVVVEAARITSASRLTEILANPAVQRVGNADALNQHVAKPISMPAPVPNRMFMSDGASRSQPARSEISKEDYLPVVERAIEGFEKGLYNEVQRDWTQIWLWNHQSEFILPCDPQTIEKVKLLAKKVTANITGYDWHRNVIDGSVMVMEQRLSELTKKEGLAARRIAPETRIQPISAVENNFERIPSVELTNDAGLQKAIDLMRKHPEAVDKQQFVKTYWKLTRDHQRQLAHEFIDSPNPDVSAAALDQYSASISSNVEVSIGDLKLYLRKFADRTHAQVSKSASAMLRSWATNPSYQFQYDAEVIQSLEKNLHDVGSTNPADAQSLGYLLRRIKP